MSRTPRGLRVMRHPLHIALPVAGPVTGPVAGPEAGAPTARAARAARARHRKPPAHLALWAALSAVPPARRVAAGLGLASVLAATVLTAAVEPSAPVAPDRNPAAPSSNLAQVSRD
ncbi:hypothetical protein OHS33_11435 [Streptomyces sp. NBC_00536]|uniref:hypothetical protein n=1 Tax=Streptomyces sp. NBC_00536 TaxID=2975769 RepID=UPI002E80B757|nr:hypothetical protein [Streptomyces sp. NBC_00536]WUC78892.1 hypothetical protein OHS33_11435 [Streptomyces sp. NBC_00536]